MKDKVVIYSTPNCHYCTMAKNLAEQKGCEVEYKVFGKDFQKETMAAYKGIGAWSKKPPKSPIAKKWIEQQKKQKTR